MSSPSTNGYPENPVVVRVWRNREIESVHRGAWCMADSAGAVLASAGDFEAAFFVRSSIKPIQALPLLESGAADRFDFSDEELALTVASHSGESCHTERVGSLLRRLGLSESFLRCGAHEPMDPVARAELKQLGREPTQLHNNCSGKHAGFLALAKHLGVPLEDYLDPSSEGQELVRAALAELTNTPLERLVPAVDGCSAPAYRLSLRGLATAFARITSPRTLPSARAQNLERVTCAVARNPVLLAGSRGRLDTDLVRATGGRLLPKIGAEAIYAVGLCGGDRALAIKIDDGGTRGLFPLVVALLERLEFASPAEIEAVASWREAVLQNHAGLPVGRVEPVLP